MQKSNQFFVYILTCADDTLYIGYTTDLEKRVHAHNTAQSGAKYTKARRPVVLAYYEEYSSLSEALKREYALKQLTRDEKLALIKTKNL